MRSTLTSLTFAAFSTSCLLVDAGVLVLTMLWPIDVSLWMVGHQLHCNATLHQSNPVLNTCIVCSDINKMHTNQTHNIRITGFIKKEQLQHI